ncbi:major facilitator superfamily domain-containing protein [Suillus clintonianus]|uniref:major facilitator superfamily domain-containing protein n=1 Tax=Suillus clintonianus TaxID=1904413 RepID=UPI001B862CD4|nr:major facilitator superfamily domain-containing protein [Suillus clintonianus]KAG2131377.1 major facilitator superfamily domain-containing protein [Suillus clintonianus]
MAAIPDQQSSHESYHEKGKTTATVLDERRRAALAEIDNAPFSWFHVKVCLVAGVGFFTDAYDIFAINIAATMLGYVYGHTANQLNTNQSLGVKVATPVGNLVGQLLFGWLADHVGRKRMYGVELMVMIIATFGQALAGQAPAVNVLGVIIVWRFIMGVGIGGDYPLSAIISSEFAATHSRGRLMTAVFASQGWGQFASALVGIIVVQAYKNDILSAPFPCTVPVDYTWRLLIGLGCVPGVIALYFRLTIPETPRFTMDIERNVAQATADVNNVLTPGKHVVDEGAPIQRVTAPKATRSDFAAYFGQWKNMKVLIGTSYSWFALDIAFYGLGLNSAIILTAINFGSPTGIKTSSLYVYQNLYNICVGNLILSVAGLIPGYWVSFLFIDSWGRKPIQLMGFSVLTILFVIMGFGYDALNASAAGKKAFVFLYCLTNFFQNFGPNTTTFVIPGEAFPTRYRSTGHGISAATGKLGAIISQVGFAQLVNIGGTNQFVKHIMEIFALFMLTGIFSTLLIPETKQRSLEDISNEEQEGYIQEVPEATRS